MRNKNGSITQRENGEQNSMKEEFGYSQLRFNYITDYANTIAEQAIQMEMAWQNRNGFKDDVNVEEWINNQKSQIERNIEEFKRYLQPNILEEE